MMTKIKNLATFATLALTTLAAPLAALAATDGDIWEIHRVDPFDSYAYLPPLSATESLKGGETAYFVMRLVKRSPLAHQFELVYRGHGAETIADVTTPFQIGIYVSGRLQPAQMVDWYFSGEGDAYTDIIFAYKVNSGDFARPIRLADANGNMMALNDENANGYYVWPSSRTMWYVQSYADDHVTIEDTANFQYRSGGTYTPPQSPSGQSDRVIDYDLSGCNFNVRTVDFDETWERNPVPPSDSGVWRSVHEGPQCQVVGAEARIVPAGVPDTAVTLYVWAESEGSVKLPDGEWTKVYPDRDDSPANYRWVQKIEIQAGKTDYGFRLQGMAKETSTVLYLSACNHFTKNVSTGEYIGDYIKVPVACVEPLPASVKITPAKLAVTAKSTWTVASTDVQVSFSEAFTNDVEIEIVTGFSDGGAGLVWSDYVRYAATADSDVTLQADPVANPVVVIEKGKLKPTKMKDGTPLTDGKLYLYALRSDAHTVGANKLTFAVKTANAAAAQPSTDGGIDGWSCPPQNKPPQSTLSVDAQNPEIVSLFDGADATRAVAGSPCLLKIAVADDYADTTSTNGYEIYVKKDTTKDNAWTKLDGLYVPGKGGVLFLTNTTDELPTITYTNPGDAIPSAVYVKAPVSGNESAERAFTAQVTIPAGYTVETADGKYDFQEGANVQLKITLDQQNDQGDIYAYLKGASAADDDAIECKWAAVDGRKGVRLRNYESSLPASSCPLVLIDGDSSTLGSSFTYEVVFLTVDTWPATEAAVESARVAAYRAKNTLVFTTHNVMPTVEYVSAIDGKYDIDTSGDKVPGKYPMGIRQKFSVVVNEPGTLDKTITEADKKFQVRWFFQNLSKDGPCDPANPGSYISDGIVKGDPDTTACEYDFPNAGLYTVTVELRDKDMTKWEKTTKFSFQIEVVDQPSIRIETESPYNETMSVENGGEAKAKLVLDINECNFPMTVRVKISPNSTESNPGTFQLQEISNVVTKVAEGVYDVTVPRQTTEVELPVYVLDGTLVSKTTGFKIEPSVVEDAVHVVPNSGNKHPHEYYLGQPTMSVKVLNDPPTADDAVDIYPIPDTVIEVAKGQVDTPITWNFTDVKPDFEKPNGGITVEIRGCDKPYGPTNFTSLASAIKAGAEGFKPSFESAGTNIVVLTIKDKDNSNSVLSYRWAYVVADSKGATLVANGPGTGSGTPLSKQYSGAKGLGKGHVWASSKSDISVTRHRSTVNCGLAKEWTAFAYGYAYGAVDNGWLDGGNDTAINASGDNVEKAASADVEDGFYKYAPDDGKDSFLYAWLVISRGEGSSSFSDAFLNGAPRPAHPLATESGRPFGLPTEAAKEGGYEMTQLEAVFAKEWRVSDNMGDINADGIPDLYAELFKFVAAGGGEEGAVTVNDLDDFSKRNDDGDFLPGTVDAKYAALIPGLYNVWSVAANAFTAKMEIRGFGDGLNDAYKNPLADGTENAACALTDVKTDPDFSDLELQAALTLGYTNATHALESGWTPERPTDPTKADTDDDGLPDGYEYYFWYRATVGYFDKDGKYRRLTGRKYNPARPDGGDIISWQEIAKAFDPLKADETADIDLRDTDQDGLPDVVELATGTNPIEWDTDGDGLPDGWEVMHGYDPLKAKTDDQYADGTTNPDGDYMAAASVKLTVLVSADEKTYAPKYFATTREINAATDLKAGAAKACWSFKVGGQLYATVAGDLEADLCVTVGVDSAEEYYLKADLLEKDVFAANEITAPIEGAGEGDPTVQTNLVRGAGAVLLRGTKLDEKPVKLEAANGYVEYTLAAAIPVADAKDPGSFTNCGFTAWKYGANGLNVLDDGETCRFAMGRSAEIPKTAVIVGGVNGVLTSESVLLIHAQVYQWRGLYLNKPEAVKYGTLAINEDMGTGFNPTTAWMRSKENSLVNSRWINRPYRGDVDPPQEVFGARQLIGLETKARPGHAVDTQPFATRDEFLLASYWIGCGRVGKLEPTAKETWLDVWKKWTTIPVNVATVDGDAAFGADTDGDGVPDGWELYVANGPSKGLNINCGGTPEYDPLDHLDGGKSVMMTDWVTKDSYSIGGWTLVAKFAGTDTMIAYADVPSVANPSNLHNPKWINKFWPLDPWSFDTDCDGVSDDLEGVEVPKTMTLGGVGDVTVGSMIYGNPTDDGSICIAGGGMNPCSWDTDLDGLPDLWEAQHADGKEEDLSHHGVWDEQTQTFGGGMDATVKDAYTHKDGPNRDYDFDGLQNWQEYLTGVIRAFRYDDALSPWTVPQKSEADGSDEMFLKSLVGAPSLNPLVKDGGANPNLVFGKFDYLTAYCSVNRRAWDSACGYWYFFPDGPNHVLRQGLKQPADGCVYAKQVQAKGCGSKVSQTYGPCMYFTTSPRSKDSDADGMDDYYELFHGMDPLYGGDEGRDLVALRWAAAYPFNNVSAKNNVFTYTLKARGTSDEAKLYDFTVYPWMAGDPAADPDGDDIRNVDEAIQANAQANQTWLHTDPTPLWMTDTSDPNSIVSRYYGAIATSADPKLKDQYAGVTPAKLTVDGNDVALAQPIPLMGHRWGVENAWLVKDIQVRNGYNFVFEENEGYDTDHDGLSDAAESKALAAGASDPQDSDDPIRRQAIYFPGVNSALQARSDAVIGADSESRNELFFLEFTVECWVKPEDLTRAQTILERVIRHPNSNPGDKNLFRRNFQLGIDETGRFFAAYDSNGTGTDRVTATAKDRFFANTWTHLAATFDGQALVLYVNGTPAFTKPETTHPATSAETIVSDTADGGMTQVGKLATESAIVMGASILNTAPCLSLVSGQSEWTNYGKFYQGYLDEVRIWDGVRDPDSIQQDYQHRRRYTTAELLANREAVFAAWSAGLRRNFTRDVVVMSKEQKLPPELVYHYAFDGLFGAVDENLVAQEPNGFSAAIAANGKAAPARPKDWASPGWRDLSVHSLQYHNYAYVPWIPNLVAHLPAYDGTTLDSVFWSTGYAGKESATSLGYRKFGFPLTHEAEGNYRPLQQTLNVDPDATRLAVVGRDNKAFMFARRARVLYSTDLLPLGDAYVRFSSDFWDDNGPTTISETSGKDEDFDNLPDWWEALIAKPENGYTMADGSPVDPAKVGMETALSKGGLTRKAGEWFRIDTSRGAHDTAGGGVLIDDSFKVVSDTDGNGIADWWASLYGIHDALADDDFDGLRNIDEYVALVNTDRFLSLDFAPNQLCSDGMVMDYFRRLYWDFSADKELKPPVTLPKAPGADPVGKGWTYAGFVLTDHDMIENWWEDLFDVAFVNSSVYDAYGDKDDDGWSNWAEARAFTDPTREAQYLFNSDNGGTYVKAAYPVPSVKAKISYSGEGIFNGDIVVKAWKGDRIVGMPDATWRIAGAASEVAGGERYIGYNPNAVVNLTIGPTDIALRHCTLEFFDPTMYDVDLSSGKVTQYDMDTSEWLGFSSDVPNPSTVISDVIETGSFGGGTVNYVTGATSVDLRQFQDEDVRIYLSDTVVRHVDLKHAFVRIRWRNRITTLGDTKTVFLSQPDQSQVGIKELGRLREGRNTFVAFCDYNKNGELDPGEPCGAAHGVDIGWDALPDLSIQLKDDVGFQGVVKADSGAQKVTVSLVRTKINGRDAEQRTVWTGMVDPNVRSWYAAEEMINWANKAEFDIDWASLAKDARGEFGLEPKQILSVEYAIYADGVLQNTVTRTFASERQIPVPTDTCGDSNYVLKSIQPTFAWTGGASAAAFRLQVAKNDQFGADDIVYDSGVAFLPAGRTFTAPVYVGSELADKTNYYWRVAEFDARFRDSEGGWSEPASFRTAVDSTQGVTGYGRLAAEVRYYGASSADLTNVVVCVCKTADFTGMPVARKRLAADAGTKVSTLAVMKPGWANVATNVEFDGIAPGYYYVMAFIDTNGNMQRDPYESWGYLNRTARGVRDIYTPETLEVKMSAKPIPGLVVMEDTDVNQDEIPDCIQGMEVSKPDPVLNGDADNDGLTNSEESDLTTDPELWDTDGDGMPDGWENWAGIFPKVADADRVVEGDVMAYAVTNYTLVTVWDGSTEASATNVYAVVDPKARVARGDVVTNEILRVLWQYGAETGVDLRTKPDVPDGWKVYEVAADKPVVLVHGQVYEAFGYDPTTANPAACAFAHDVAGKTDYANSAFGANTKPFTALDKYLLVKYFEMLGYTNETYVNTNRAWKSYSLKPGDVDNNRDGVPDGWELYVMFGTGGYTNDLAGVAISPFEKIRGEKAATYVRNKESAPDKGGLAIADEWDFGHLPSDPWQTTTKELALGGVTDADAFRFHVKSAEDQLADEDFDGLSNWAEYLATKAGFGDFDVTDAYSAARAAGEPFVPDYFCQVTNGVCKGLYVGEAYVPDLATPGGYHLVADHDFIEDWFEDAHGMNRYAYDANLVSDKNYGWDNWSRARAMQGDDVVYDIEIVRTKHTYVDMDKEDYERIINDTANYEVLEDNVQLGEGKAAVSGKLVVNILTRVYTPREYPTPYFDLTLSFPRNAFVSDGSNDIYVTLSAYTDDKVTSDAVGLVKIKSHENMVGICRNTFRYSSGSALRQGPTTFVATGPDGELMGVVRDVVVGWDRVTNLEIEMRKQSAVFPAFAVGASNVSERVKIVRTAINGKETACTVWKSPKGVDSDFYTEADFVRPEFGAYDLDWHFLHDDLALLDLTPGELESATYEVVCGTNVIGFYEKTFAESRVKPELTGLTGGEKLLAAQPTFTWNGDEAMTAFVLQLSTNENFAVDTLAVTNMMPPKLAHGRTFRPAWYVGEELKDATVYHWRVAELNAKFQDPADGWSETGTFTTAADCGNANTGYGPAAVEVRYYGPATNALADVVVAAYATADFTGKPLARRRLAGNSLTNLAYVAEAGTNWLEVATNAAGYVRFDGLPTNNAYLMAFVDANTNGVRDAFETWGYVCKLGTGAADIWSPVPLAVVSAKHDAPSAVLVMEDTDIDQDLQPDCLETWDAPVPTYPEFEVGEPSEPDVETIEETMEYLFGKLAPVGFMAYEELEGVTAMKIGENWYAAVNFTDDGFSLRTADIAPGSSVTNLMTNATSFVSLYVYGNESDGLYGLGTNVTFDAAATVADAKTVRVCLVHAQVYAKYGFEPNCAVVENAVHTKPFTPKDKYLVCRYFENIGVTNVSESAMRQRLAAALKKHDFAGAREIIRECVLDPRTDDSDFDGVADGWELYVMFGEAGLSAFVGAADHGSLAGAEVSPFNVADGQSVAPGKNSKLKLVEEYDGGYLPTDPWSLDTDGDCVIDFYAYWYHLKGLDAGDDFDGDGLSNYAEYLITEVYKFAKVDPDKARTSDGILDYYQKAGDFYVGEVFTDHDMMDDVWEGLYPTAANRYVWDPNEDPDGDGWSNFAEFRAGTDPSTDTSAGVDTFTKREYPVPVVEANVVYNSTVPISGPLVFQAWNEASDVGMNDAPNAFWSVGGESSNVQQSSGEDTKGFEEHEKYVGRKPTGTQTYYIGPGEVAEGTFKILFKDTSYVVCDSKGNPTKVGRPEDAQWYFMVVDKRDASGQGVIQTLGGVFVEGAKDVGTLDYKTGMVTIDFSKFTGAILGDKSWNEEGTTADGAQTAPSTYDLINLDASYVVLQWKSRTVGNSAMGRYYLADPDTACTGHLREGKTTFVCFVGDSSGKYVPGAPFGIVRGVDVGWAGAKFTVELSETSAITPRIDLWDAASKNDRATTIDDSAGVMVGDPSLGAYPSLQEALAARLDTSKPLAAGQTARIRVVRYGIDDYFCYSAGVYDQNGGQLVVMDKKFNPDGRNYLCEADFLGDNQFDIDWGTLAGSDFRNGAVVSTSGTPLGTDSTGPRGLGLSVSNMTYLVVLGEGDKDFFGLDSNSVRTVTSLVTRRFEVTRHRPVVAKMSTVYSARPTFTWSIPNEEAYACKFGSSYTAFRLQILETNGTTVVYDSGVRRAPAQDKDGNFVWEAPVAAGQTTTNGMVFSATGNWTWRVAMYNAKFMPQSVSRLEAWSNVGSFSTAVNAQQEVNDHGYSSVGVTVKYAGATNVLAKGVVRVQAFADASFSGDPLAEATVTNDVADLAKALPNAKLVGLAVPGTYYVRAFIDMNTNVVKDAWESWGYAKSSVTFASSDVTSPVVGLYIEDADTDGDLLPDAWEIAQNGSLEAQGQVVDPDGKIVLRKGDYEAVTNGVASISTGLEGATLTFFENIAAASVVLGLSSADGKTVTIDDIRTAVAKNIVDGSLKITSFTVAPDGKIHLTVDAKVADSVAGKVFSPYYTVPETLTVTLKIEKQTALGGAWTFVKNKTVTFGKGQQEVPVDAGLDLKSGFYRVTVTETPAP